VTEREEKGKSSRPRNGEDSNPLQYIVHGPLRVGRTAPQRARAIAPQTRKTVGTNRAPSSMVTGHLPSPHKGPSSRDAVVLTRFSPDAKLRGNQNEDGTEVQV
jgi:hypothetical protein